MSGRALAAAAAIAATLASASAPAQAVDSAARAQPVSACASTLPGGGPTCAFEHRLVVDLQTHGPGAPPDLRVVVDLGALAAGVFALSLAAATARDSMFYAVVQVERDAAGTYGLRTGLAGPRAPGRACASGATGHAGDLAFGAFLATQVTHLVNCAQARRPVAAK